MAAVIPAAGSGVRMGGSRPKQYLEIHGRPIMAWAAETFQRCHAVGRIVLVVPPSDEASCRKEIVERFGLDKVSRVVPGGSRRQDSVRAGLEALSDGCDLVLIHDGARPVIDVTLVDRIISETRAYGAVVPGLPVRDTVKEVDASGEVIRTLERGRLWSIQTPQGFIYEDILQAHRRAFEEGWPELTDDAAVAERAGIRVRVVEGIERNIKITRPEDLGLATFYLGQEP